VASILQKQIFDPFYRPVLNLVDFVTAEPSAPARGAMYISSTTGVGSDTGVIVAAGNFYWWDGTSWQEEVAIEGQSVYNKADDSLYTYDGTTWNTLSLGNVRVESVNNLVSSAGNIAWTGEEGNMFYVNLTEDVTLENPSAPVPNAFYTFRLIQDGNGPWGLTLGSSYKTPGGVAPNIALDPGGITILTCYYDGTNLLLNTVADFR